MTYPSLDFLSNGDHTKTSSSSLHDSTSETLRPRFKLTPHERATVRMSVCDGCSDGTNGGKVGGGGQHLTVSSGSVTATAAAACDGKSPLPRRCTIAALATHVAAVSHAARSFFALALAVSRYSDTRQNHEPANTTHVTHSTPRHFIYAAHAGVGT